MNELLTFIGLLFLAGVYRSRFEPLRNLWNGETGRPAFMQAMSRTRFEAITRFLRFDSKVDRAERRERDKLAPIRVICDKMAAKFRASFSPGEAVCVDEQLLVYRGRCPFKIYLPSKPGKYGMKLWICADVETSYCVNFEVYTGRQGHGPEINQGARVVLQLTEHLSGSGRNCTGDNFFSSLYLSNALLQRKMTYIGTVRKNKPFLPTKVTDIREREELSSAFAFQRDTTLVSYVPKKGKNVILKSTFHHDTEIREERDDKKPQVVIDYNRTKGAVDNVDKLVRTYSTIRKSRRWPMVVFGNLLDLAAYNAYVLFSHVHPEYEAGKSHRRRLFLEKLALDLVQDAVSDRAAAVDSVTAGVPVDPMSNLPRQRLRCRSCPRNVDRKTTERCSKCCLPVCKRHLTSVCEGCLV